MVEITPEVMTHHIGEAPQPDQDRIYFMVWPDAVRHVVRYGVKQHKKFKKGV
ncbi:hypothetical protein D3C85_1922930 [compost metagenome]